MRSAAAAGFCQTAGMRDPRFHGNAGRCSCQPRLPNTADISSVHAYAWALAEMQDRLLTPIRGQFPVLVLLTLLAALPGLSCNGNSPEQSTSPPPANDLTIDQLPPRAEQQPTPPALSPSTIFLASHTALANAGGYHLDLTFETRTQAEGNLISYSFEGEANGNDRLQGNLSILFLDQPLSAELIVIGDDLWTREHGDSNWIRSPSNEIPWGSTTGLTAIHPRDFDSLELVGREEFHGLEVYHLRATVGVRDGLFSIDDYGGVPNGGELSAEYWISVENLLPLRSTVTGNLEVSDSDETAGGADGVIELNMTVTMSDPGIQPLIEVPPSPTPVPTSTQRPTSTPSPPTAVPVPTPIPTPTAFAVPTPTPTPTPRPPHPGLDEVLRQYSAPRTVLTMSSDDGDGVGQGVFWVIDDSQSTFEVNRPGFDQSIQFTIRSDVAGTWSLWFIAPSGRRLEAGYYGDATRYPFQDDLSPGLFIAGQGRGCNRLDGEFTVAEAEYSDSGDLLSFAASFVQHCESRQPALRGELHFNSTSRVANAEAGESLYVSNGCSACHSMGSNTIIGPGHQGIYERATTRAQGLSADGYLRQ
jgi:hypothetical protein